MIKTTLMIAVLTMTVGCASSGRLSTLPKVENPETACDVYLIRKSSMVGAGLSYTVGIDHQDFAALASGNFTHTRVDCGSHVATVKYPRQGFLGTAETSLEFDCNPNKKVYIAVWPGFSVNIKEISQEEGAKLIQKYKAVE